MHKHRWIQTNFFFNTSTCSKTPFWFALILSLLNKLPDVCCVTNHKSQITQKNEHENVSWSKLLCGWGKAININQNIHHSSVLCAQCTFSVISTILFIRSFHSFHSNGKAQMENRKYSLWIERKTHQHVFSKWKMPRKIGCQWWQRLYMKYGNCNNNARSENKLLYSTHMRNCT